MSVRSTFSTLHDYFERLLEWITIFLMVSLALVVLIAVAYRLSGNALVWYDEIASMREDFAELHERMDFNERSLAEVSKNAIGPGDSG